MTNTVLCQPLFSIRVYFSLMTHVMPLHSNHGSLTERVPPHPPYAKRNWNEG